MPRNGSGVYSLPSGTLAVTGETILSAAFNAFVSDLESDANTARPVASGGTGATSTGAARTNLGLGSIAIQSAASVALTGGSINGTTIGASTAAAGTFTTLTAGATTCSGLSVGANNPNIRLDDTGTSSNGEITLDDDSLRIEVDEDDAVSFSSIKFRIDGTQRGVWTTAGFKVGGTNDAPGVSNTVAGIALGADGIGYFSHADGVAGYFNRNNDGVAVSIRSSGTEVGSISFSGATTTYNTTSDRRLKSDIADLTGAGERIDRLRPCSFVWRGGEAARGFIADEFQAVYPDSVTGVPDGDALQAIDAGTPEVIADLVAEVQRLRQEIRKMGAR